MANASKIGEFMALIKIEDLTPSDGQIDPSQVNSPTPSVNTKDPFIFIPSGKGMRTVANPAYKAQLGVETQQAKDIGVIDVKRKIYSKDLESFFAVDDILQQVRGNGLDRLFAGGKIAWEGFKQDSPLGRAAATHDAVRKRLRVQLVRAAGDVGNINIVEQKAAEMMIPTGWDDKGTADLKRAYLKEIGTAIESKDGNAVKEVIANWMATPAYQSNLETIKFGGKLYKIPKEEVGAFKKDKGIK